MQAASSLVSTTFAAFSDALGKATLAGAPILRTRAVDRAIEALAGYALGVFAAGVASRLSLGADLGHATAIRAALFRATSTARLATPPATVDHTAPPFGGAAGRGQAPPVDVDALLDDDRVVTADTLRAQVAGRLRDSRADAVRIVEALAAASEAKPEWLDRVLDELAGNDLVVTRFADQVERVWALLHGGTTYLAPPKVAKPEYCVVAIA